MKKIHITILLFAACSFAAFSQKGWAPVSSFGSNPGNLNMYSYVPDNLNTSAPLVIVMHGCGETASSFSLQTAWNNLADTHKFYVAYAEQTMLNNNSFCFNWFMPADYSRGQGEALSVKQMVDYMKSNYSIDSSKVFVTGLSAGACFTAVMLGAYPEIFAAGAIMAGAPYKSATDALSASNAMYGLVTKTPTQWGDLVRNENPSFSGSFPKVAIFQGTADYTVYPANAHELMKQWTNVHNADTIADSTNASFNGNNIIQLKQYKDASGQTVVETYMISNMMHGISVDPGTCFQQGGAAGAYSYDENFYSSFWAARFFGILTFPYAITGPASVLINQQNNIFSVPLHSGSSYAWSVPAGAVIVSGQGTNEITVNWGVNPGYVSVNEADASSCIVGPVELYVEATTNVGLDKNSNSDFMLFPGQDGNTLIINTSLTNYNCMLYDITGKLVLSSGNQSGNYTVHLSDNLHSGFYLAHIISGNMIYSKKFIKL